LTFDPFLKGINRYQNSSLVLSLKEPYSREISVSALESKSRCTWYSGNLRLLAHVWGLRRRSGPIRARTVCRLWIVRSFRWCRKGN